MFVRKKTSGKHKIVIQLCESYREHGRVKQRVLRHVGTADKTDHGAISSLLQAAALLRCELEDNKQRDALSRAPEFPFDLPSQTLLPPPSITPSTESQTEETEEEFVNIRKLAEERRVVEGIHDIFGSVFDKFGLKGLLGTRKYELLRHLVMARIAWPSSKLRASKNLLKRFDVDISEDRLYRLMDALDGYEDAIQKVVFSAFRPLIGERVEVLFFDVTTLYFESTDEDELRCYGFSKDQKTHLTQVVLALATNSEGLPVGYKLFPGNTAETSTLLAAIEDWRAFLDIGQVTIVADRAMMNNKNLQALEASGINYVIAAKLKKLPPSLREAILERSNEQVLRQNENDIFGVSEYRHEGRRLIVSHSTKRARKDAHDREQILAKLEKKIGQKGTTKKLVTNRGYLSIVTESGSNQVRIDETKVLEASRWDGLHGVITNVSSMSPEELLALYRRLWVIEESFRINKHTLEMRPIYHYTPRRIRAHILICYLEFALSRYVQKRITMQGGPQSVDDIRSILIEVQYSIVKHEETGCHYRLPSAMSPEARQIYGFFGQKRARRMAKM